MTATWIFLAVQGNVNFNPILTHGQKVLEVFVGEGSVGGERLRYTMCEINFGLVPKEYVSLSQNICFCSQKCQYT